jgi:hypothetical protein
VYRFRFHVPPREEAETTTQQPKQKQQQPLSAASTATAAATATGTVASGVSGVRFLPVAAASSMSAQSDDSVWQDREIRFDIPFSLLAVRRGETEIDSINAVEDTKGNNGEKGHLSVTNLRVIWCSHKDPRTNLSIGHNCILSTNIRTASSKLRGNSQALYVMTKFNNSRFEFIFTSLVKNSPRLFTTVQAVYRAYETTKLYRDLKLRGAIIKDKSLILLPDEDVINKSASSQNCTARAARSRRLIHSAASASRRRGRQLRRSSANTSR